MMNARELALQFLDEYELDGKYVNLSVSSHKMKQLAQEERSFAVALLYTTVERKLTYDYYVSSLTKKSVDKLDVHTLNILRLGLCQLLNFNSVPDHAAVNETVKLARNRGERGFVNGVLRSAAKLNAEGALPLPAREKNAARFLGAKYSFPLWISKHFISIFGEEETEALLQTFNGRAYTDLTVNGLKTDRCALIEKFARVGIRAEASSVSSMSLRINGSVNPTVLPGFDRGEFFVQDSACALSVEALDPQPNDRIVDVCAAPGGKSFAAAIRMGDKGEVFAFDLHESKISLITDGAFRLGLNSVKAESSDALIPRRDLFGSCDKVICDVPCSGLGVLGKKPDLRYKERENAEELPKLQYAILESSANYLKVGGVLIYSTCTLNPAENEDVVRRFLSSHLEFSSVDFTVGERSSRDGILYTYPHVDGTDGFFIAKLQRMKANE